MSVAVPIPKRLYEKALEIGIDVESRVVDLLPGELALDPQEELSVRLELAERFLEEAEEYLTKGDPVQASEKLYEAVEGCIKALARLYRLPQYETAKAEGRWWTQLLGKAARALSRQLGEPRIEQAWAIAYDVHAWGFHEAKYGADDIRGDLAYAKWLLDYTREKVATAGKE